jgi:hypothetical protein
MLLRCTFCIYSTDRQYNLDRHCKNKHYQQPINNIQNLEQKQYYCQKCYKQYSTEKYAKDHEEKCNGFDVLTCQRCMTTFAHKQSKYNHIKRNKCKPKSIIHYKNPNITKLANNLQTDLSNHIISPNIIPITNISNMNNHGNTNSLNTNCNNTYNIYINDFGKERTDYITVDRIVKILQTNNIIPSYIDTKHFDVQFPENQNIKFQNNMCYIRKQNKWQPIGIDRLSAVLLQTNTNELANKYNSTRQIFENIIQNVDMIEYIEKRFNYLDLMTNKNRYKETLEDIKNLLKTK